MEKVYRKTTRVSGVAQAEHCAKQESWELLLWNSRRDVRKSISSLTFNLYFLRSFIYPLIPFKWFYQLVESQASTLLYVPPLCHGSSVSTALLHTHTKENGSHPQLWSPTAHAFEVGESLGKWLPLSVQFSEAAHAQ